MKNVYTSWDLNLLADKMIEKIIASWKTPFDSPAVIFTDPKTEQWFKLRWLKNKAAGKGILMNLKTLRIQQFLFDLVTPQAAAFQKAMSRQTPWQGLPMTKRTRPAARSATKA